MHFTQNQGNSVIFKDQLPALSIASKLVAGLWSDSLELEIGKLWASQKCKWVTDGQGLPGWPTDIEIGVGVSGIAYCLRVTDKTAKFRILVRLQSNGIFKQHNNG